MGGNIVWNILPTVCPNLVTKLFNTSSGKCAVGRACPCNLVVLVITFNGYRSKRAHGYAF